MPTVLTIGMVFRLFAWTLFASFLAFIAWSLYVILPPKPRWVVPELEADQGCDDIPIYISEGGSGVQYSATRLWAASFSSRSVCYCVRELRDGSVRAESHDALFGDRGEVFFHCEGRLRGFGLPGGKLLDLPLPDFVGPFVKPIESARVSPEGDLLVLTVLNREAKWRCIILNVNDGRVLESLNILDGRPRLDAHVHFTSQFVIFVMPSEKKMVVWDRQKRAVHREHAFTKPEALHLKNLRVCTDALVLLEATAGGSAVTLRDLPDMRERTELFRAEGGDCWFRCSPDGELIVTGRDKGTIARIWHVRSKKLLAEIPDFPRAGDRESWRWNVFFSPDSRFLAAFDGLEETVFDAQNGARLWTEKRNIGPDPFLWPHLRLRMDSSDILFFKSRTGRNRDLVLEGACEFSISHNGRFFVNVAIDESKSAMFETLKDWLPGWLFDRLQGGSELRIQVADLAEDSVQKYSNSLPCNEQKLLRAFGPQPTVTVSDEGEASVIISNQDETATLTCWDVPAKRRWEWIIGAPAVIGLLVFAWRWWRGSRRKRCAASSPVAS